MALAQTIPETHGDSRARVYLDTMLVLLNMEEHNGLYICFPIVQSSLVLLVLRFVRISLNQYPFFLKFVVCYCVCDSF